MAAAAGYAQLVKDPAYPDAAERKTQYESRQRISELEAELRYHADTGSWQAVLDVAAELEVLDPASADPDGLATTARAELLKTQPSSKPGPTGNGLRQWPHPRQPSGLASTLKRFWNETPSPNKVPAPAAAAHLPATTPAAVNTTILLWAGVVLTAAGLVTAGNLPLALGLIAPAGYALLLWAGLPAPSAYGSPHEFIPAAYNIVVLEDKNAPLETSRYENRKNCAESGRDILLDIEMIDHTNPAAGGELDLWLNIIEGRSKPTAPPTGASPEPTSAHARRRPSSKRSSHARTGRPGT